MKTKYLVPVQYGHAHAKTMTHEVEADSKNDAGDLGIHKHLREFGAMDCVVNYALIMPAAGAQRMSADAQLHPAAYAHDVPKPKQLH
jgi:hypothetical protein